MKLLIKYCPIWDGYDTKALEVSKEITNSFTDIKVELIEGAKGEFSVIYQDDPPALLYSMAEKDRLPTNNEIRSLLVRIYGLDNLKTKNDNRRLKSVLACESRKIKRKFPPNDFPLPKHEDINSGENQWLN